MINWVLQGQSLLLGCLKLFKISLTLGLFVEYSMLGVDRIYFYIAIVSFESILAIMHALEHGSRV